MSSFFRRRPGSAVICLLRLLLMLPGGASAAQDGPAWRARGLEHGYNLDHQEAYDAFLQAIALDPEDATAHRLAAATTWMRILLAQGAVTVEDYLGQARASIPRTPPAADLAATFDRHLTRAHDIAERRVRNHPRDADAHFQLGAADGLRASYIATAEGRVRDSIGAARRAYAENKRSLALNPARRDAGLIVGLYQYGISSLSLPMRLLARLAGFNSGRERGLQLVEDAARFPSDAQTNARFSLVLLYNREGRFDEALAIVRELQRQYPRNRLLWLEAAGTALRAKRPDDALRDLDAGLLQLAHDPRVRGSGEEARWRALRARAEQELSRTRGARQPADEGARR